jgi:hypothetical protein
MRTHLVCLTIDTDPDGLSGPVVNRRALRWEGLSRIGDLVTRLDDLGSTLEARIPLTWFVRADGQLRDVLGHCGWLLDNFNRTWEAARQRGDELAWHPHLYRCDADGGEPTLISQPGEACDELERIWSDLEPFAFRPISFRNGEGWQCPETLATVERLGLTIDSTAIPGRRARPPHPMDWTGAPNQPYYPRPENICEPGPPRRLLEIPMNTWLVKAPYDAQPQLRYMNPAVHEHLFGGALREWTAAGRRSRDGIYVWVLVFHPDEVLAQPQPDALYAGSPRSLCQNVATLYRCALEIGDLLEFATISRAAERWKGGRAGGA